MIRVLGSEPVQKYLKAIAFNWDVDGSSNLDEQYFAALNDRSAKTFVRLYLDSAASVRQRFGDAIGCSLQALLETGTQAESSLSALWLSDGCAYLTSFWASDHNWIGLMKDTMLTCTFAVATSKCLEFRSRSLSAMCLASNHADRKSLAMQLQLINN